MIKKEVEYSLEVELPNGSVVNLPLEICGTGKPSPTYPTSVGINVDTRPLEIALAALLRESSTPHTDTVQDQSGLELYSAKKVVPQD